MELNQKLAVVTGVSKGLGLEVVKLLLKKGTVVAGWGRNQPSFTHSNFHFFSCSPMNLGNILSRAGFDIIDSSIFFHKWPPYYFFIKRIML